jgi:hypothetical protein
MYSPFNALASSTDPLLTYLVSDDHVTSKHVTFPTVTRDMRRLYVVSTTRSLRTRVRWPPASEHLQWSIADRGKSSHLCGYYSHGMIFFLPLEEARHFVDEFSKL